MLMGLWQDEGNHSFSVRLSSFGFNRLFRGHRPDSPSGNGTASVKMTYGTKVVETTTADDAILTVTAIPTGTYTYALTVTGNPGSVGNIATASAASEAITLASTKSMDYETTNATPASGTAGTATVTVEIKNKLEYSNTHYVVCVADGATADKAIDDTIAYTEEPANPC
ncbi:hypothetical protein DPMN_021724 [Dreissena polymorpha]|uniref:Uncharacterized protein n=1 Tax=Dreissena polymorpha TaxID=45954 RepID=A0A9D4NN97_DREPO|nr:hypothetical protein DPMN_021724 [Dreissena polymorpha]